VAPTITAVVAVQRVIASPIMMMFPLLARVGGDWTSPVVVRRLGLLADMVDLATCVLLGWGLEGWIGGRL
jgi:hypothetical protein